MPARPYLVPCLLACFLSACTSSPAKRKSPFAHDAGPAAPVPVEVVILRTGLLEDTLRFSANVEAEVEVQSLARTAGQITELLVEEGDAVEKNQVLLRLGDAEQRTAFQRAQIELAHAERTYRHQQSLRKHGVVSEDAAESAKFEVSRAKIAETEARRLLRYTTIRATVAGTITARAVKRGDFVSPSQPLFTITDFSTLVAKVFVSEKDVGAVRKGQSVRLFTLSEPSVSHKGLVSRIAPVVDPRSGTAKVTISLPGQDKMRGVRPGSFLIVQLVTRTNADALLLPRKSLVYDNDQAYAFRILGDKAQRLRVKTEHSSPDFVEAIGFLAGDKVVVAGQYSLEEGARVLATLKHKKPALNTALDATVDATVNPPTKPSQPQVP